MQVRKNKILTVILLGLITLTLVVYFSDDEAGTLDIDKDKFAFTDPSSVDKVILDQPEGEVHLDYKGNKWLVNNEYEADPQRIKVLFAIIKQVSVRRKVAKQDEDSLQQAIQENGIKATFFSKNQQVHSITVLGNEQRGITYMTQEDSDIYLVEIPGYRSYLAGVFLLDANAWRDPLVFDVNWRNLQKVSMFIPDEPESSFDIVYDNGQYQIEELTKTDTTKLFNVLDDISLLYVNDYLTRHEVEALDASVFEPTATIVVEDVGQNKFTLEIFQELNGQNVYLVRKDSIDYGTLDSGKLRSVLRPRRYFKIK